MENWEYCMDKQAEAVQEFIDEFPIKAFHSARNCLLSELTRRKLENITSKTKIWCDKEILSLEKQLITLDEWLEELGIEE